MPYKAITLFSEISFLVLILGNHYINTFQLNEPYIKIFNVNDGEFLLITKYGFRLYDNDLETLLKHYDISSEENQIESGSGTDLVIASQFSDGIIIASVKKIFYVFDSELNYIFEQDLSSILINTIYLNLMVHSIESSTYYFIVSYYDTDSTDRGPFTIKYLSFSMGESQPIIITVQTLTYIPKNSEGNECEIQYYGLSCQLMKKDIIEYYTCFYQLSYPYAIGVTSFSITKEGITPIDLELKFSSNEQSSMIKSAISPDKTKALICYTKYSEYGSCLQYDINTNEFSSEIKYFNHCNYGGTGMNVYYFSQKNEYIFICYKDPKGFNVVKFDSSFYGTLLNSEEKSEPYYRYGGTCYYIYSFELIYSSHFDDYMLISDCLVGEHIYATGDINLDALSQENSYPIVGEYDVIPTDNEPTENNNDRTTDNEPTENNNDTPTDNDPLENNEETTKIQTSYVEANSSLVFESTTKSKEELITDLDNLIKDKDPEQSYVINGEDFTMIIKPVNEQIENSTVNIDFSSCEKVLKEKYPTKEFRIAQINIGNKNDKCISDQVEYKIYDENGDEIDLSICDTVDIVIEYKITNLSLINLEQISDFKEQGIDIFNLNSDFFNDICYSYSNDSSSADMILSDRVKDIYQNFSICGDGCQYESFNIEKASANCNCKVKQEVSTEKEKGNFKSYIVGAFLDSNFGVIKCFNLVFSLKGKLKNIGFWIFGIMIICHIPIYILYFLKGTTNPVLQYINKEMDKKGYAAKNRSRKKKRSVTPRMESTKNNLDSPSVDKKETIINDNPPKKRNISSSLEKKKKLKKKIIKMESLSENNNDNHRRKDKKHKIEIENISLDKENKLHLRNKNNLNSKDFNTLETILNSPNDAEEIKKKKTKKSSFHMKEKKNKVKSPTKEKKGHKGINNLITTGLESGEFLTNQKEIHKSIKFKETKSHKKENSAENNSENKFQRNSKRKITQFPLILINANNTINHAPLLSNYSLNNTEFEEAINYEKRKFCRIFFIYLISKENVLNIIFFNPPLELTAIRICVFIFSFACDFALNALFYLSEKISDKYHYTGPFKELYTLANNLIISITSVIVSVALLFFFQSLTQSNSKIEKLFRKQEELLKADKSYTVTEESKNEIRSNIEKIVKCLKIKIIIFMILELIFMLFFFYYVTAFCQVYRKTQISWLLDCLSSYVISFIFTVVLSLVFAALYKLAIKYKLKLLYKISTFIY